MPFLQSSGAISINNIKTLFGGPTSPSLANYYRGGAYVPSQKTVQTVIREPASGELFSNTFWMHDTYQSNLFISWSGSVVVDAYSVASTVTSWTSGSYTYFRGSYRQQTNSAVKGYVRNYYATWRTYPSSYQASINTGIPSSGTISLNQFYGAEKP